MYLELLQIIETNSVGMGFLKGVDYKQANMATAIQRILSDKEVRRRIVEALKTYEMPKNVHDELFDAGDVEFMDADDKKQMQLLMAYSEILPTLVIPMALGTDSYTFDNTVFYPSELYHTHIERLTHKYGDKLQSFADSGEIVSINMN